MIEVKRDDQPLTEEDRDQAISYARVVNPIAPFVMLTNGRETKLYRTLDREEINRSTFQVKGDYELEINAEHEYQFLQDFIGYSSRNLKLFSQVQVETRTRPIVGKLEDRLAKYIAELYEPRLQLEAALKRFIDSNSPGFLLLGDSGSGKTAALCHLALTLTERGQPVFFYRGFELTGNGLLNDIAADFNWEFSQQHPGVEIVRRLQALSGDTLVLLILDAVDEWVFNGRVASLLDFISRIRGRIKLVASCKTAAWAQFLTYRNASTGLDKFFYHCGDQPYFTLGPMDEKEFGRAYARYRHVFEIRGYFEDQLLREMKKNPLLMRIAFEVAAKRNDERLMLSNRELLRAYYETCIEKVGISDARRSSAQHILDKLAGAIFLSNQSSVPKEALYNAMNGGLDEDALAELLEFNIVEKEVEDDQERLGFYFSKLRDYIVAFRLKRWDRMTAVGFAEEVEVLKAEGVQQDALLFFYPLSSPEKREFIDGPLRRRAEEYLRLYRQVLQEHFDTIKRRFPPFTSGQIGFIGQLIVPRRDIGFFGFREIDDSLEEVLFLPYSKFERSSNVPYLFGGSGMHVFGRAFLDLDWRQVVLEHEVSEPLKSIVKGGQLDEAKNPELLAEIVAALVYDKQGTFKIYGNPSFAQIFPLSLTKMHEGLRRTEWEAYYREKKVGEKVAKGELREGGYSFPGDFSLKDMEAIRDSVDAAMLTEQEAIFEWRRTPNDEIARRFLEAKAGLNAAGIDTIDSPVVDPQFLRAISGAMTAPMDYIREQFLLFYEKFLANYIILVERKFSDVAPIFQIVF